MRAHEPRRGAILRTFGVSLLIVAVWGTWNLYAQAPYRSLTTIAPPRHDAAPAVVEPDVSFVNLLVGRSAIVNIGTPIQRVSLTSADVADALVTSQSELLVNAKAPGTISMFVWDRTGAIRRYEVVVQRDLSQLTEQIRTLFPGESVEIHVNGRRAVLSGHVSSKVVAERIVSLATGFVETKDEITSLLQVPDAAPSNQVLLRVRFAEVSRNALTELGATLYGDGATAIGRSTTGQFPAPAFDQNNPMVGARQVFSDFLNLFFFDFNHNLGVAIKALQTKGLFQSLAEPNLVAESGKEASFLAGGEFPIPVAQGSGLNVAITVQFKEFGIRLNFTPVVNGQRVHLKVRPEVSTLDFNNAVTLQGFRIPALSTRRTETELDLRNGQTFAISGLMNNSVISSMKKIPGVGDIPVLGKLFQSKAAQKDQTELVVMITPEILPDNSSGVTPTLPRTVEPYLPAVPEQKLIDPPPPAFPPQPSGSTQNEPANRGDAAVLSPEAAAAIVTAIGPSLHRVVIDDRPPAPPAPAENSTER